MTTIENNRCYACGKLFCCLDCCNEHIKKKHPSREYECPLCHSDRMIVKNFDNPKFHCHVVFHHMPLRCLLCGLVLNNSEDLQQLGICNRLAAYLNEVHQKSILSPEISTSLNKTPCGQAVTRNKDITFEGDYNGNFGDLTSPPELSRNTSTPVHVKVASLKANFVFKTPRSPNFSLKTPKTSSQALKISRVNDRNCTKENCSSANDTNYQDAEESSSNYETNYLSFSRSTVFGDRTPLRSILSNRSVMTSNESSSYFARSSIADKKLDAMRECNEEMGIEIVDMDLTGDASRNIVVQTENGSPALVDTINRDNQQKEIVKRVRFSDQFEIKNENEVTDNEEFFEARQSMSELSIAVVEKLSSSSALIERENAKNYEQEKKDSDDTSAKSPKKSETRRQSDVSSSSRVIMMVVVENNGSVNATDLAPLIDSSLKKLEIGATSGNAVETMPAKNDNSRSVTSVVSVDSYMSVSSVERYTTPETTINVSRSPRETTNPSNATVTSGGIFATMAHVMRMAFRNLPGANSLRNLSREPVGPRENLSLLSSTMESNSTSANVLTSLASTLEPRPAKRSRDTDEIAPVRSSDSPDPINDVRSPLPKRPRGWYKIRGREPIARMRKNSVTSTRGVSLETQCFQQGSLSVGDTILPIPSRAHQSTQTD